MKKQGKVCAIAGICFGLLTTQAVADQCATIPRQTDSATLQRIKHCLAREKTTKSQYFIPGANRYIKIRRQLHQQIINNTFKAVPCRVKPVALFSGGVMGGGKTTALAKYFPSALQKQAYVVISADDIREDLPEYRGWNSLSTQAESHDVEAALFKHLLQDESCRRNVLLDSTLGNYAKNSVRMKALKQAGYQVDLFYVKTPLKIAEQRALYRYKHEGQYGRYVAPTVIANSAQKVAKAFRAFLKNGGYDGLVVVSGVGHGEIICASGRWFLSAEPKSKVPKCTSGTFR